MCPVAPESANQSLVQRERKHVADTYAESSSSALSVFVDSLAPSLDWIAGAAFVMASFSSRSLLRHTSIVCPGMLHL